MRYSSIREMDISNGTGVGVALFVQGCPLHCENCFNKDTWDFNGGKEWTEDVENDFINLADRDYITRISILGGEPLAPENIYEVIMLIQRLKQRFPGKKVWLYTGYTYEHLIKLYFYERKTSENTLFEWLNYVDYLVDGRFIDNLKDYKLKFRGSSNQRILSVADRQNIEDKLKGSVK